MNEKTFGRRYPEGLFIHVHRARFGYGASTKGLFNMLDNMLWIFAGMLLKEQDGLITSSYNVRRCPGMDISAPHMKTKEARHP
jgi:hypothetical protein